MSIVGIKNDANPFESLIKLFEDLHKQGPRSPQVLESITYYKCFHNEAFGLFEERLISALGLFYKQKHLSNIYSFLLSSIGRQYFQDYGSYLTPVQASIRRAIDNNQYISISAPTSTGKSYSIRDFIAEQQGDVVVVVPSRALIAEYINAMKRKFAGNKEVMVSSFVDVVYKARNPRRIFVLTPERARDLFSPNIELHIGVFFLDEAQVSDESKRGVIFDTFVRRARKRYPEAKMIFAHPFAGNPDAQLKKHQVGTENSFSRSYTHGSVGRLCIFKHKNGGFYYFSPNIEGGHLLKNCFKFNGSFEEFAFNGDHSVLVYVSKASIYKGTFLNNFQKYIDNFPSVESIQAKKIIEAIQELIGADDIEHRSNLIFLLKRGVVVHHGSVPLEVRFLLEDFIRSGFAKICFATSTLAQGINMPFDIVWIHNFRFLGNSEDSRSLAFKNLIGRAGRLTPGESFDYGYVYTTNPKLFNQYSSGEFKLREKSILDDKDVEIDEDDKELVESIRDGTFDEEKHLPSSKVDRLSDIQVTTAAENIIEILFSSDADIRDKISGDSNAGIREKLKNLFQYIFEVSLNRQLMVGEEAVFRQAMFIFFQVIQEKSFKEIVGLRYSYISNRDQGKVGDARFTQPANKLPDIGLIRNFPLLPNTLARNVNYDSVVFDTYDYLDQVISYSLSDTLIAAFTIYMESTGDQRANNMINLFRYGTVNSTYILLMRYGFPPENVHEIADYVAGIDEHSVTFNSSLNDAPRLIREMVDWYLP